MSEQDLKELKEEIKHSSMPIKSQKELLKALEAQIKLKEYIERINQPEYDGVAWKKDEVVLLLKELLAE